MLRYRLHQASQSPAFGKMLVHNYAGEQCQSGPLVERSPISVERASAISNHHVGKRRGPGARTANRYPLEMDSTNRPPHGCTLEPLHDVALIPAGEEDARGLINPG